MKKKKLTSVKIGDKIAIGFTEEQGHYLEAIEVAKHIIEELTDRNMENFSFGEIMKLRSISLDLTKMLADRKISMDNYKENEEEIMELIKVVIPKLKEAHMLRLDLL